MAYKGSLRTRGNPFGRKKVEAHGYSFASKLEAAVFEILKLRERAGELKILQVQDHIDLSRARIRYVPDFKCLDVASGIEFWVEAKGYASERWPTVKKLWKYYGPGRLEIWMGHHSSPQLSEVIVPKMKDEE